MRICLAVAAILALCVEANASDIVGKRCSAQADARGLSGQDRAQFRAWCRAGYVSRRPNAPPVVVYPQYHSNCLEGVAASLFIGGCPLCVPLLSLAQNDAHCPSSAN